MTQFSCETIICKEHSHHAAASFVSVSRTHSLRQQNMPRFVPIELLWNELYVYKQWTNGGLPQRKGSNFAERRPSKDLYGSHRRYDND